MLAASFLHSSFLQASAATRGTSSIPVYGSLPTPSQTFNDYDNLGTLSPTSLYVSQGQLRGKNKDVNSQQGDDPTEEIWRSVTEVTMTILHKLTMI